MNFPDAASHAWREYERAVERLRDLDRGFGDADKIRATMASIKIATVQNSSAPDSRVVGVAANALADAVRPDLNQYVKDVLKAAQSDVRAAGERLRSAVERDLKAMGV